MAIIVLIEPKSAWAPRENGDEKGGPGGGATGASPSVSSSLVVSTPMNIERKKEDGMVGKKEADVSRIIGMFNTMAAIFLLQLLLLLLLRFLLLLRAPLEPVRPEADGRRKSAHATREGSSSPESPFPSSLPRRQFSPLLLLLLLWPSVQPEVLVAYSWLRSRS
jgi:hypothetical protein